MSVKRITILCAVLVAATAMEASGWVLELKPAVELDRPVVRLADVALGDLPKGAAELVLGTGGKPGGQIVINRNTVLRKLVTQRLAAGVTCDGPEQCVVSFTGRRIDGNELEKRLLDELSRWLPRDPDRGPESWMEISSDLPEAAVDGPWRVELIEPGRLEPGRNLVRCKILGGGRVLRFTATVTCHSYGEVARTLGNIARDACLGEDLFAWEWRDMTEVDRGWVVGRGALVGMTAQSALEAGRMLRQADIRAEQMVRQGESVELMLNRGGVRVSLRGTAREDGAQGEMIYVRNELDGRLIRARVTGQGRVTWSR